MATKGATWPTLLDVAQRADPDGRIPEIAEMQHEVNPILEDMPWFEGNRIDGHKGQVRAGLPTVALRALNVGTAPSKSETMVVTDTCAIIEAFGEIDEEVYDLDGGGNEFRMSEDQAHIEGMAQKLADLVFYGDTTSDPKEFVGLHKRYSSLSADNGGQIIDAGGTGADNTSIWHCVWDKRTLHGIYPKGMMSGLKFENLGKETKRDSSDRLMRVYVSHFLQKAGIHLKDWAAVARIANIDVSDIATAGESGYSGPDLVHLMIRAWFRIPQRLRRVGRRVFYCNSTLKEALVSEATLNKAQNTLTVQQLESGEPLLRFWGIPVLECDAIINTEAQIT